MPEVNSLIATELNVNKSQIDATVALIDDGATIPFIARYRKEVTGGLDDTQLRHLFSRLNYLRELNERCSTIITSIESQGKLTPDLHASLLATDNKSRLEELYLPFKPKRRTKGQIAIEAGIEPLADSLFERKAIDPIVAAKSFINKDANFNTEQEVLDGARFILMERIAENSDILLKIRNYMQKHASCCANVLPGKESIGAKFNDYFEYQESLSKIPSHRALAILRGRNEGILSLSLKVLHENQGIDPCEQIIIEHLQLNFTNSSVDSWLKTVIAATWKVKIALYMENELLSKLKEQAEDGAIKVFAQNLGDLIMAPPAGAKVTMGLDPGIRTGVKIAIVDETCKFIAYDTIYPHGSKSGWEPSLRTLANLVSKYNVELIAIGNGTASRETEQLVGELISKLKNSNSSLTKVIVSEAGASVYSASEFAAKEFPDLDVSIRGAVSIARRLQDPLAELVKIDPKSIGVGQYQHDINQAKLNHALENTIEDCVNAVGVDLNMASIPLLSKISGLNSTLAQNIVQYRDLNGKFTNRKQLLKVTRLGPKAFEQSAGFLKIVGGEQILDASAVHPEAYDIVEKIATSYDIDLNLLINNSQLVTSIDPEKFVTTKFGLPTIKDILKELDKPGRDPRGEFKTAHFKDGVKEIKDLEVEMILEGTVTNVTDFGAFVDIGVHQDGLVHISMLTDKFVSDPREIVKAGAIITVKVLAIDIERKRISLTAILKDKNNTKINEIPKPVKKKSVDSKPIQTTTLGNAFANALAKQKR